MTPLFSGLHKFVKYGLYPVLPNSQVIERTTVVVEEAAGSTADWPAGKLYLPCSRLCASIDTPAMIEHIEFT